MNGEFFDIRKTRIILDVFAREDLLEK